MRHRRGTPGLTPYRLRTIEAGYPRRRRPPRHLRRTAKPSTGPSNNRSTGPSTGTVARLSGRAAGLARRTDRRVKARLLNRIKVRIAGSQVAMGIAGAITLALLAIGGYQAAAGAVVVLGMF